MASVWLTIGGRDWHVDEGTAEYEKLVLDGAQPCDDPTPKPKRGAKNDDGEG